MDKPFVLPQFQSLKVVSDYEAVRASLCMPADLVLFSYYAALDTATLDYGYVLLSTLQIQCVPFATELAGGPLLRVAKIIRTTDPFIFVSHTTNVLLFNFRCNIFICV